MKDVCNLYVLLRHWRFIPSQLLSAECLWKLRLSHPLRFRILSSMSPANPQKSTMSLDPCHQTRWLRSKVPHYCSHTQPNEQTHCQPSNHHARVITVTHSHMLDVHHARVHKVDFKYQPHSCRTDAHKLEIIQCVCTSVHTVGFNWTLIELSLIKNNVTLILWYY